MDNTFRVGQTNTNDKLKALITFTDFDLIPGHQLLLWSDDGKSLSQTLSDLMVELPLFLNLTSHSIASERPFSGRGFKANLKPVSCGGKYIVKKYEPLILTTPTSLANTKKCVWIVSTEIVKALNVTIDYDHDQFDFNHLKFYDSNSIRDNQVINSEYFLNNTFLLSSTNSLIIDYTIPNDNAPSLKLIITEKVDRISF